MFLIKMDLLWFKLSIIPCSVAYHLLQAFGEITHVLRDFFFLFKSLITSVRKWKFLKITASFISYAYFRSYRWLSTFQRVNLLFCPLLCPLRPTSCFPFILFSMRKSPLNISAFKDAAPVNPLKVVSAISCVSLMEREGFVRVWAAARCLVPATLSNPSNCPSALRR